MDPERIRVSWVGEPPSPDGLGFQVISWNGRRPELYRRPPESWKYPEEKFDPLAVHRELSV